MSSRRVGRCAVMLAATLVCVACGDIYRPVVIPTTTTPPNPANFHAVFGLNANLPGNPGTAVQIDVSGDSVIGQTPTDANNNVGWNSTHVALLPSNSRVFVASAGAMFPSGADIIAAFSPAFASTVGTGLGSLVKFPVPPGAVSSVSAISESGGLVTAMLSAPLGSNVQIGDVIVIAGVDVNEYNGTFTLTSVSGTTIQYVNPVSGLAASSGGTASVPALPVFLNSTQNTAMYVANYNSSSVAVLNTSQNVVSNNVPVGIHPVALAETPDGRKLYVANQGSNSLSSLNTVDMSQNTVAGFSGTTPAWVVARSDSHRVYVLTQGDGQLITMDTSTDSAIGSISVGVGANFAAYDSHLNRLYVANPANGTVYVVSTTGGANDTPTLLKAITISGLSSCPTCSAAFPTQVAALRDGSRFYVASYQTATACPDPNVVDSLGNPAPCVIPQLAVIDANSLAVTTSLYLLASPMFQPMPASNPQPYAVPPIASCAPAATFTPGSTRFRMTTAAAADSSRVYVGMCDAGAVASVNTTTSTVGSGSTNTPDTLVLDLIAPFSAGPPGSNGEPPPQQPIFLVTGQ
jgi:YVTN family beta-propeller protein